MNWWELPGPRAFITAVERDVREGKSVFIQLPDHCPKRLSGSIRQVLGDDLRWFSTTIDTNVSPTEFLYNLLVVGSDHRSLRTPYTLIAEPSFQRHVIWIEGLSPSIWPAWGAFFLEYERAGRSVHPARRTHFLVPLRTSNVRIKVPTAIGLSEQIWNGWLRYGDMHFYSCTCVGERPTSLETELTVALVAELARWDPDLCEWLSQYSVEQLVQPRDLLSKFSAERGWNSNLEVANQDAWTLGACQIVKGKSVPHACLSSLSELERLVWKAEITVLMPYIEEQRQNLLQKYQKFLRVPFTTAQGQLIDSLFDLEIGHIEWQLVSSTAITREELSRVTFLKDARNSLSHFEPVDERILASVLRSDDI